jgi:hypothetical protein
VFVIFEFMKVMFCFDFQMREDCDAHDEQIYHVCMCCVVSMITFFLVRLFCDRVARQELRDFSCVRREREVLGVR